MTKDELMERLEGYEWTGEALKGGKKSMRSSDVIGGWGSPMIGGYAPTMLLQA